MGTSGYAQEAMVEQKVYRRKTKKIGFFKRKMRQWLMESSPDEYDGSNSPSPIGLVTADNSFDNRVEDGMTLTIHNANGGYVVSFRKYDRRNDRSTSQLYIISSDQKFEEALAQCIAMECLTR